MDNVQNCYNYSLTLFAKYIFDGVTRWSSVNAMSLRVASDPLS
jgi:hypothetical protein